jgi:Carbohydrate binding module (family 6)
MLASLWPISPAHCQPARYSGTPFHDSVYNSGPQKIPGRVQCAYFDLGGEGVAYHNTDSVNKGSGMLNPANGSYLNEFRMKEAIGTSYVKYHDAIDDNPFDLVKPAEGQLYVGWTNPGEWINMTVRVERAGVYEVDLLYTSNRGGSISLDLDGRPLLPAVDIISTRNAAETVPWRQWHHWNLMRNIATVRLPQGKSVLTLNIVSEGNMNLAYLDFRAKE